MSRVNCFSCYLKGIVDKPMTRQNTCSSGKLSLCSPQKPLRRTLTRKNSVSKSKKGKCVRSKDHKKRLSINFKALKGKEVFRSPKIYENQLFRDVYDRFGNHDRVFDTSTDDSPVLRMPSEMLTPGHSLADQSTHETKNQFRTFKKKLTEALKDLEARK